MLRTHTCGDLQLKDIDQRVTLCGWVHRIRNKGAIIWIDLRDRYGITQLMLEEDAHNLDLVETAKSIGREYVLQVSGTVIKRFSPNPQLPTGDIEVRVERLHILNISQTPPFLIEPNTDGGEDLRMEYRYLDLRRSPLQKNLLLRHLVTLHTHQYLSQQGFLHIETPFLIKSTPGGARDFLVPSRIHAQQFYALPQSPQVFKQLLMIGGLDRYYQIVKCFRDEDMRADRQPEFTQIDCELSFVTQADILALFEAFIQHIFKVAIQVELPPFPCMTYQAAMEQYGVDKPDIRFNMPIVTLTDLLQSPASPLFEGQPLVAGLCVSGGAQYSRNQLDGLTKFIQGLSLVTKTPIYIKYLGDNSLSTPLDKYYDAATLHALAARIQAVDGDLLILLAGDETNTRVSLGQLRLKLRDDLNLVTPGQYAPLWVVDFPLLEWDEEKQVYTAVHHPFTSPKAEDIELLSSNPAAARANAYDLVINGVEIGGGSIRIHEKHLQEKLFDVLGLSPEEMHQQFGFMIKAFEYGTPPHGGIAFGLDRLCAVLAGEASIKSFIAFPKNNAGRDVMMQAPAPVSQEQLSELGIFTP